jgi:chromosome segregation ATPase
MLIALTIGAILTTLLTIPAGFDPRKQTAAITKKLLNWKTVWQKYRTDLIDTQNKNKDLRQRILELEETKQNLERTYQETKREINDLQNALGNANLTLAEAEQAKKEAIAARNEMDAALLEMEAKLSSPLFKNQEPAEDLQTQDVPNPMPEESHWNQIPESQPVTSVELPVDINPDIPEASAVVPSPETVDIQDDEDKKKEEKDEFSDSVK